MTYIFNIITKYSTVVGYPHPAVVYVEACRLDAQFAVRVHLEEVEFTFTG